jgi:DNA (cytosine-5)-methyltransferase 1
MALGRSPDIAINHDPEAIAMHRANHPETKHYCENVWKVDPVEACGGRPVGLLWASPDCTHHSRAKGSQPVKKHIRGLAWAVIRWAHAVRPRVIMLENVPEFAEWCPVIDGRPDKTRKGETFKASTRKLRSLGYAVEFRELVAADYGTPTTRRRLFLIARRDGQEIVWPEATHGRGRIPWRPASDIIDWSLPCPSIFGRSRPLAEATLRRIAAGIQRYVVDAADPFIVPVMHPTDARVHSIREPLRTVTAAHRGEFALVAPYLVRHGHYSTITGAGLEEGRGCGTFRGQPCSSPLATVCATNDKHLVAALLTKHYGGVVGQGMDRPIGTVTAKDHHSLTAAFLMKYHGGEAWRRGQQLTMPLHTIDRANRYAEVRAFLVGYYSNGGSQQQSLLDPIRTITGHARFGLVMVHGEPYAIADIGMRMLQPRELFRAQGFPEDYKIEGFTKTQQIAMAGNSVCPQVAAALVRANVCEQQRMRTA